MPGGKTKYKPSWGSEKDGNGDFLKSWCCSSSTSEFSGYCKLCKTNISVDNSGLNQLLQHAKSKKHVKMRNIILSPGQSKLTVTVTEEKEQPGTSSTTTMAVSSDSLGVLKAETIWAMKVASSDMSYRSCEGIASTFDAMFNCPISNNFKMSRSKVSYIISDGLKPYFQEKLIYDINSSKNPVTLHYDETTTAQVVKQMDLHFHFWSAEQNEIVRRFYTVLMFGPAEGAKVAAAMVEKLE